MESNASRILIEELVRIKTWCDNHGIDTNKYETKIFDQVWSNTSGGFGGIGGCALTTQTTCVLIPKYSYSDDAFVFFHGDFAYKAPQTKEFCDDVYHRKIAGVGKHQKYYRKQLSKI